MKRDLRFAKFLVILNGAVPGSVLAWDAVHHQIGANGVNYALHTTGLLSFILLLLSLLVTPLRSLTGWNTLIAFRRSLGLWGFVYACVHFLIFFGLDRAVSVSSTVHEVVTRRYLQIGTAGLLLMVPLAVTSTNRMVAWLGAKRWKALHRTAYLVAIAAAIHYYLLVKSDVRQPLVFAAVLTVFLGFRLARYVVDRRKAREGARVPARRVAALEASVLVRELRVARTFDETPDVRTFRLMFEGGRELPFNHMPGQYLNLALDIDGKHVNRSYTIASSPTRANYCEVTVKRSATGYGSGHLHDQIRAGSTLKVSAPAGRFVFTGERADRVVLIAGGVGITPLMSMVRYLTDCCWSGEIYFVFSVRQQKDLIFREELAYLERRHPNLHVCATLSKEEPTTNWSGERGAISKDLLTRFVPNLIVCPIYLCGPDGMMMAMRKLLGEMGLPDSAVKTEAFVSAGVSSAPPLTADIEMAAASDPGLSPGEPPPMAEDGGGSSIRFARSGQVVANGSSRSVLETAEDAGVSIPSECRAGICGQCKTKLVAGRVTMEAEDALSAAEKSRGLILACQAHAVGDITVDA